MVVANSNLNTSLLGDAIAMIHHDDASVGGRYVDDTHKHSTPHVSPCIYGTGLWDLIHVPSAG